MNPLEFFLTFLKASLFSTGGFGNLPSLHQDLLAKNLATNVNFGQAIAVGQISPGPNGLWVIALGYFSYGFLGAFLALCAICIPPFFVLALERLYQRIEHFPAVQGVMRGIALATVGSFSIVVSSLLLAQGADWRVLLFAVPSVGLIASKRVNVIIVLALAALGGYLVYR